MWPFRYRTVLAAGLRTTTGAFAYTTGVFRQTLVVDECLQHEQPETIRMVLLHEECHRVHAHGLLLTVLFPFRALLLPWVEAVADRYAVKRIGPKAAGDALRRIYPCARTRHEARVYGWTWRERAERAGAR